MEPISQVQAVSPIDGRYSSKTNKLGVYFSEFALIKHRVQVEIEWLIFLANHPDFDCIAPLSSEAIIDLKKIYQDFTPENALEVKEIEQTTNHDVKAVEYFINNKLKALSLEAYNPFIHFACTSEDINNLSYSLMVNSGIKNFMLPLCERVLNEIRTKAESYRHVPMMARTHGQPATPTTMGKEFYNFFMRLSRQFKSIKNQEVLGKLNGAVGNFNAHVISYPNINWREASREFVESLGLTYNPATTQIEPHDYLAEIFHQFMRWNTILLDMCRDIWSYISLGVFKQKVVKGEVGSSTMPHKVNPIDFENGEGNIGLANAIFDHMASKLTVSRWQRDLSDSTVLRNIGVGMAYSTIAYNSILRGLGKIEINESKLADELNQNWILLGEALQTVMRKHHIKGSYEKLKDLTRGQDINKETMQEFIKGLELPEEEKIRLLKLTPANYLGYAERF